MNSFRFDIHCRCAARHHTHTYIHTCCMRHVVWYRLFCSCSFWACRPMAGSPHPPPLIILENGRRPGEFCFSVFQPALKRHLQGHGRWGITNLGREWCGRDGLSGRFKQTPPSFVLSSRKQLHLLHLIDPFPSSSPEHGSRGVGLVGEPTALSPDPADETQSANPHTGLV